jgi:opacity protein-like surface antigen
MIKQFGFIISIALIFIGIEVRSQQENFLGLSFGGAIPQGSFSEDNYKDSTNGFANTGFMFGFDVAWFPDDYLGIGATVTFASNNPDKSKYTSDLKQSIVDSILIHVDNPDVTGDSLFNNIVLDYGVWKYLNLFVGPNVTVPVGQFNFDFRLMGGVSFVWKPGLTMDINYPEEGSYSRSIQGKAVPALGYSVGVGVRYALKKNMVLRLIAEYANTKPTFEFINSITYNNDPNIEEGEQNFTVDYEKVAMPIKNIHVGIGIAYNFEL